MSALQGHFFKSLYVSTLLFCLLVSSVAMSKTHIWSGGAAPDTNWSTAGNWALNGVPGSNDTDGTIIIFFNSTLMNNKTSTMNIPGLVVDLIQFGGSGYTINNGGSALGVNGNVVTTNIQNDQGTNVINCPMNFSTNAAILTVVTTGSLSFNGNISSAAGSNGLIVTNGATGTLTIGGTANNSYTGNTSVQSGMLLLNSGLSNTAIPGDLAIGRVANDTNPATVKWLQGVEIKDTANVTVFLSGTMDLNNTADTIASLDVEGGKVTLGTTGTATLQITGSTTIVDGTVNLGSNTFNPASTLTMTGGMIQASTGVLKLGGDVTATASPVSGAVIALGSGSMTLNNTTRNFTVAPGTFQPELLITGVIADGSVVPSGLKKKLTGLMYLKGSQADTYSGTTTVDQGVLGMNTTNGHIINGPIIIGNNTDAAGVAILRELVQSNDIAPTSTMTINGSGVFDLGGEIDSLATLSGVGSVLMGPSGKLTLGNAANFSYGGIISGSNDTLTKVGSGTMTLTGTNSYTGLTVVSDGEVDLNTTGGTSIVTDVQIGDSIGAANSASLVLLQSGQLKPTCNVTVNTDGLLNVNGKTQTTGPLTITGGNVSIGTGMLTPQGLLTMTGGTIISSTGSLILSGDIAASSSATAGASITAKTSLNTTPKVTVTAGAVQPELNFGGILSDGANGPQGIFKSGNGTLGMINSITNTYTGTTTVDAGIVTLNSSSGVEIPGVLIIGNATDAANSAVVRELNSDDLTTTTLVTINASGLLDFGTHKDSIGSLTGSGNINTGNGFSAGGDNSSTTFDGTISGTGGFSKIGTGVLTFTNNNTYANTTTITAGTLVVNGSQPSSPVQVAGGTLGGHGTVGATTVVTGTLNPGAVTPSTLSIMGNLTLAAASTLKLNIGTSAPNGFDSLNVAGTVTLSGSTLMLNFLPNLAVGGKLTLIANDGTDAITGTFAGVAEGMLFTPQSQQLTLSYVGGTGNDLDVTALNLPPTISSGAQALPNPATLGQTVTFAAIGADPNLDTLTYAWNFGDSTTGTGATPTHIYTVPGSYNVSVTVDDGHGGTAASSVSVLIVQPLVGEGPDSDGDGFSDSFEGAAGTSPTDGTVTPTGGPAVTPSLLPAVKLAVALNFSKANKDTISLSGTVPIPAGFVVLNQRVTVAFGGVAHGFTLNAKGSGVDAKNTFKLPIKAKKGVVSAQTGKYAMKLTLGSFATALAADGLTNVTVKTSTHIVPITLIFNKTIYQLQRTVVYKATMGKTGTAK